MSFVMHRDLLAGGCPEFIDNDTEYGLEDGEDDDGETEALEQ
jgi:hypothetical protein